MGKERGTRFGDERRRARPALHAPFRRLAAVLILGIFLLCPALLHAAGECWVEAYNALAGMINELYAVKAFSGGVALKQPGNSVTQADLEKIRKNVVYVMTGHLVMPPEPVSDDPFAPAVRWENGALVEPSLMSGIGRNGYFTAVPPEYTASGAGIYANSFTDVPLLWVHFEELHRLLLRARFTEEEYYAEWLHDGTPNRRSGDVGEDAWGLATAAADLAYLGYTPITANGAPRAEAVGKRAPNGDFMARRLTFAAYGRVWKLSEGRPRVVHFYGCGLAGKVNGLELTRFDAAGVEEQVELNRWRRWNQVESTAASVRSGAMLGEGGRPAWGPATELNTALYRGSGWAVAAKPGAVIEWTDLGKPAVKNPQIDDPEDDGWWPTAASATNACRRRARTGARCWRART